MGLTLETVTSQGQSAHRTVARMHSTIMESFPAQSYENKLEFEYSEPAITTTNHQHDIAQSVNDQTPSQEQLQVQEDNDTSTLQQQQQQAEQVTQPNAQQGNLTPVRLPAILDGEFFLVTRVENSNVTVRCLQCQKLLNGNLKSTGNFLSHIKRLHPFMMDKIRCKSNQRKPAMMYVDSTSPDKCSEVVRMKRVVLQKRKRCKMEESMAGMDESYSQQPADWNNDGSRRQSEEMEPANVSLKMQHNSFVMEDEYDAIGRNVAAKLRSMTMEQRIIAEKLLNDILFEAQLGNLHRDSSLHV
ncbi:uncharacterized protein LOC105274447 isoform X1 [Ooceraea biroi]|uniref:uncharacterized protein LOC105274447 isoform X1 n=1 Tax=Ooceraea biroi TaxID=2015173 RepID=UPI0005BBFF29|nr:uncharacterized protein LOC105274447 isoform X1 [Ooceraea biroi]XP_011328900.1 uncharacterized protein LOC105274447 isoform X1 [Ooceraea biroi]